MSFYNTTKEEGQLLLLFEAKAKTLEKIVLEIYQMYQKPLTWSEVHTIIPEANQCSLKRSITNLKTSGKLEKTKEKGLSIYGKPSYKYRLTA